VKVEKGDMHPALYYPLAVVVKLFDIVISLFVGILDIVGNIAKVISLSFRLTGNLMSGTILLGLLVGAVNLLSQFIGSIDCPVLFPVIVVLWGILGAVIQAFVFSLLTAIFIKVAVED
jgi:F-type H+-transporting ATPase subunit a